MRAPAHISQYRSHSGPTKHRYADETYIELFDPDLINLPPHHCLPAWWGDVVDDFDDEWVETDPPPKETKKDKKNKKDKEGKEKKGEGENVKEGKVDEKEKEKREKEPAAATDAGQANGG